VLFNVLDFQSGRKVKAFTQQFGTRIVPHGTKVIALAESTDVRTVTNRVEGSTAEKAVHKPVVENTSSCLLETADTILKLQNSYFEQSSLGWLKGKEQEVAPIYAFVPCLDITGSDPATVKPKTSDEIPETSSTKPEKPEVVATEQPVKLPEQKIVAQDKARQAPHGDPNCAVLVNLSHFELLGRAPTNKELGEVIAKAMGFTKEDMIFFAAYNGIKEPWRAFFNPLVPDASQQLYKMAKRDLQQQVWIPELCHGKIAEAKQWLADRKILSPNPNSIVKLPERSTFEAVVANVYNPIGMAGSTALNSVGDIAQGLGLPLHLVCNKTFMDTFADSLRKTGNALPLTGLYTEAETRDALTMIICTYAQAGGSMAPYMMTGGLGKIAGMGEKSLALASEVMGSAAGAGQVYDSSLTLQASAQATKEIEEGRLQKQDLQRRVEEIKEGKNVDAKIRHEMEVRALMVATAAAPIGWAQGKFMHEVINAGAAENGGGLPNVVNRMLQGAGLSEIQGGTNELIYAAGGIKTGERAKHDFNDEMLNLGLMGLASGSFSAFGNKREVYETAPISLPEAPKPAREFVVVGQTPDLTAIRSDTMPSSVRIKVREVLVGPDGIKRTLGPEQTMNIQHQQAGQQVNINDAAQADLVAVCGKDTLPAAMQDKRVIANTGSLYVAQDEKGQTLMFSSLTGLSDLAPAYGGLRNFHRLGDALNASEIASLSATDREFFLRESSPEDLANIAHTLNDAKSPEERTALLADLTRILPDRNQAFTEQQSGAIASNLVSSAHGNLSEQIQLFESLSQTPNGPCQAQLRELIQDISANPDFKPSQITAVFSDIGKVDEGVTFGQRLVDAAQVVLKDRPDSIEQIENQLTAPEQAKTAFEPTSDDGKHIAALLSGHGLEHDDTKRIGNVQQAIEYFKNNFNRLTEPEQVAIASQLIDRAKGSVDNQIRLIALADNKTINLNVASTLSDLFGNPDFTKQRFNEVVNPTSQQSYIKTSKVLFDVALNQLPEGDVSLLKLLGSEHGASQIDPVKAANKSRSEMAERYFDKIEHSVNEENIKALSQSQKQQFIENFAAIAKALNRGDDFFLTLSHLPQESLSDVSPTAIEKAMIAVDDKGGVGFDKWVARLGTTDRERIDIILKQYIEKTQTEETLSPIEQGSLGRIFLMSQSDREISALSNEKLAQNIKSLHNGSGFSPERIQHILKQIEQRLSATQVDASSDVVKALANGGVELACSSGMSATTEMVDSLSQRQISELESVIKVQLLQTIRFDSTKELPSAAAEKVLKLALSPELFRASEFKDLQKLIPPQALAGLTDSEVQLFNKSSEAALDFQPEKAGQKSNLRPGEFTFGARQTLKKSVDTIVDQSVDRPPLNHEQLNVLLDGLTPTQRQQTVSLLEQRAEYLSAEGLRETMRQMEPQLPSYEKTGENTNIYKNIDVLVLGESSPGKGLTYQFRKATGIKTNITVFNPKRPLESPVVCFDRPPHPGETNYEAFHKLVQEGKIIVPEQIQEFYGGVNYYDVLASTADGARFASKVRESLANQPAVKEQTPAIEQNRDQQIKQIDAAISGYDDSSKDLRRAETLLYLAQHSEKAPPNVVAQLAASDGVREHIDPSEVMKRMVGLHSELVQKLSDMNVSMSDVVFVQGADKEKMGSSNEFSYLFRLANGMDGPQFDSQFSSLTRRNSKPAKYYVYVDDVIATGRTAVRAIANVTSGGKIPDSHVIVLALASHASGLERVGNAHPNVTVMTPPGIDPTPGVDKTILTMIQQGKIVRRVESTVEAPAIQHGLFKNVMSVIGPGWDEKLVQKSSKDAPVEEDEDEADGLLISPITLPYMVPNNTSKMVRDLATYQGFGRHCDSVVSKNKGGQSQK
jgi:hypothetical protein